MQVLVFVIVSSLFAFSIAEEQIQKDLEEMDEKLWPIRDSCLKENSMALSDLKDYKSDDEVPERDLCFFKCFYTQLGILDDKGKINFDVIDTLVDVLGIEKEKTKELVACAKEIGDIETCNDIKKFEKCMEM